MSETPQPPDGQSAVGNEHPKREYHAPELRDIGSLEEVTQTGSGSGGFDGSGYLT